MVDIFLLVLGGSVKCWEKLLVWFGDIFFQMYLIFCILKCYEVEGCKLEDVLFVYWVIWDVMYKVQQVFDGVIVNFLVCFIVVFLYCLIFLWGYLYVVLLDEVGYQVV